MAKIFSDTVPQLGDMDNVLLGKILQRLNGVAEMGDTDADLLAKILDQLNGISSGGGGGGGAAQTPWTSNIDGAGFSLSNASSVDGVTAAELGRLSGVTSPIQTQFSGKQPLDSTLTSFAAYNTAGLLTQTAADTFTGRTLTGTSNKIDVTNGNGVSGNPTLTISSTYAGQSSIATIGTLTNDLLFTDATYDIGKTGATRPRDIFLSRNLVAGTKATVGVVVNSTQANAVFGDCRIQSFAVNSAWMISNSEYDGTDFRAVSTGKSSALVYESGDIVIYTAPSATAGNVHTFADSFRVRGGAPTSSLVVNPDGSISLGGTATNGAGSLTISSATKLIQTSVAMNNGAAAQLGTLSNAPAAGNPTKWIPIIDNGTTRYIPCW